MTLLLLCGGGYLAWAKVTENRQKARAEEAVRSALDRWCSKESWEKLRTGDMGDSFGEFISNTSNAPRPTGYEIGDVARGKHGSYVVAVTLKFLGGPETRLYEVTFSDKSGRSHISTKASEDVSNTEGHARAVLQSWLDSWAAGEELATFKSKHPEAAGQLTMDVAWATHSSKGKRLVRYEIGAGTPTRNGFKFTVEAMLEDRGTPETEIIYYEVFKDRTLSGGRWTITGTSGG